MNILKQNIIIPFGLGILSIGQVVAQGSHGKKDMKSYSPTQQVALLEIDSTNNGERVAQSKAYMLEASLLFIKAVNASYPQYLLDKYYADAKKAQKDVHIAEKGYKKSVKQLKRARSNLAHDKKR